MQSVHEEVLVPRMQALSKIQRYKRSLMEEAVAAKIKMKNHRQAKLKFGTEFGTIALGVNDIQVGMEASGVAMHEGIRQLPSKMLCLEDTDIPGRCQGYEGMMFSGYTGISGTRKGTLWDVRAFVLCPQPSSRLSVTMDGHNPEGEGNWCSCLTALEGAGEEIPVANVIMQEEGGGAQEKGISVTAPSHLLPHPPHPRGVGAYDFGLSHVTCLVQPSCKLSVERRASGASSAQGAYVPTETRLFDYFSFTVKKGPPDYYGSAAWVSWVPSCCLDSSSSARSPPLNTERSRTRGPIGPGKYGYGKAPYILPLQTDSAHPPQRLRRQRPSSRNSRSQGASGSSHGYHPSAHQPHQHGPLYQSESGPRSGLQASEGSVYQLPLTHDQGFPAASSLFHSPEASSSPGLGAPRAAQSFSQPTRSTAISCIGAYRQYKLCNTNFFGLKIIRICAHGKDQQDQANSQCNIETVTDKVCPESSRSIWEVQCASYNNKPFMGRFYEWEPFAEGLCRLSELDAHRLSFPSPDLEPAVLS
ncbi:hypothetical protein M91_21705 [Bos mutus]|uniref:Uncharacterized protein n=1 Tax=Bos mutus TaxID=72004 RepID=L8IN79_9CETA|nr:hypothetical protein M91_21705 [Bos mutus]